jgi:hypothetical protein
MDEVVMCVRPGIRGYHDSAVNKGTEEIAEGSIANFYLITSGWVIVAPGKA